MALAMWCHFVNDPLNKENAGVEWGTHSSVISSTSFHCEVFHN